MLQTFLYSPTLRVLHELHYTLNYICTRTLSWAWTNILFESQFNAVSTISESDKASQQLSPSSKAYFMALKRLHIEDYKQNI